MGAKQKKGNKIPKSLVNKIKLKDRNTFLSDLAPSSFLYSEHISCLPPLPKPTPRLREVLISYNSLHKTPTTRKKIRKGTSKRLSAFILFRSFYSLYIGTAPNQRTLSGILSKIWKEEIDQDVWMQYSFGYSKSSGELDFTSWLCSELKLNFGNIVVKKTQFLLIEVEDIFITKS